MVRKSALWLAVLDRFDPVDFPPEYAHPREGLLLPEAIANSGGPLRDLCIRPSRLFLS